MALTGTLTRAAITGSGSQAVTGIGGKPYLVNFIGSMDGTAAVYSDGSDNVSSAFCIYNSTLGSSSEFANSIHIINASGNGYTAKLTSLDSDGFTVAWTVAGTGGAVTIKYMCW